MHRSRFSPKDRSLRSRLAQLVHNCALLRGSLSVRKLTCGKPGCRCAKGEKHLALYLVRSHKGRPQQLCIPKNWQERVRQWVQNYQIVRDLLHKVSDIYWDKVAQREE